MSEDATPLPAASVPGTDRLDRDHLRKEIWTMALYVTLCLLAALTALQNVGAVPGRVLGLIWGTTIGLALVHLFAFRVAGRVVNEGRLSKVDQIVSAVQLAAAATVALIVTIPVLIAPPAAELNSARYPCAFIIGVVGYGIARSAEKSRMRSALYGLGVLALAFVIAAIKHALAGH